MTKLSLFSKKAKRANEAGDKFVRMVPIDGMYFFHEIQAKALFERITLFFGIGTLE